MTKKTQRGFETMAAAIWILAFGCLAILTQRFLVDRKANLSKTLSDRSIQSAQIELNEVHRSANRREWISDHPRNKRWRRKLLIQKPANKRKGVEQKIAFDASKP